MTVEGEPECSWIGECVASGRTATDRSCVVEQREHCDHLAFCAKEAQRSVVLSIICDDGDLSSCIDVQGMKEMGQVVVFDRRRYDQCWLLDALARCVVERQSQLTLLGFCVMTGP